MSRIQVHVENDRCEPGERLEGRVDWQVEGDRAERILVSLLWYTAGKGTEDVKVVEQVEVTSPSMIGSKAFDFVAPEFPWSFSGTLMSLVWAVEASLEPKGDVSRVDVVVAPGGEEIRL